jgi:hypothetical protein
MAVLICVASLLVSSPASAAIQDSFAGAFPLAPNFTSFSDPATDVSGFTRDGVEVNGLSSCGSYPSTPTNTYSVWYSYQPAASGWLTLSTLNPATNYDTVIEVWKGSVSATTRFDCNDDGISGRRQSELTIPVVAGTQYYITIRRNGSSAMNAPTLAFDAHFSPVRELFVDQTNGNDSNTGSAASPFRTIGRAASLLPAAGGMVTIIDPGFYNEAPVISVPTTLNVPAGAVTIASVTLATSPITLTGTLDADTVFVQLGGKIQEAVGLVKAGGTVQLADGDYAEKVTINKSLALRAVNEAAAGIKPASGTALTLAGGTVTVTGLSLQADTGVVVTGGTGHVIYHNNIIGNTSGVGVDNQSSALVDAAANWWGDRSGPPGDGDDALGNTVYRPWCVTALPDCSAMLGAATQLRFTTSPSATPANAAFAAQPVVEAIDDEGNLDPTFTGPISVTIKAATGTAGATLSGTQTINAAAGVADFAGQGLKIDYVGQGYQLAAASGGMNSSDAGDSAPFNITADRLVVAVSPASPTAAGAPLGISVAAQDGAGHTDTTFASAITLSIQTNPTGAVLQGTTSKSATAGVATFASAGDANIQVVGTGYRLQASSTGLLSALSNLFDIGNNTPSTLVFGTSPSNSIAGVAFATQPIVRVEDGFGNVDTSFNGPISLAIAAGTGAPGATLNGTTTVNAVNGVATFSGLNITKAAAGYQLSATSAGLSSATSGAFNITADTATQLVFTTSPSSSQAGVAFAAQPAVEARDQYGNTATGFNGTITLSIKSGTGTAGAALAGTVARNASSGVASFAGLSINLAGTAYQLTATNGALTADSSPFNITANGLVFIVQPMTTVAGQPLNVQVAARDLAGNTDTTFTGAVTLVLKNGGRRTGAILFGTTTINAVNGVADFSAAGVNIQKAGTGYILSASASGLPIADSAAFDIIAGSATKLAFVVQPANTPAGAPLVPTIEAQDAYGNLDDVFTGTMDLAIQTNPGGGTLSRGASKAAVAGTVTFTSGDNVNIDRIGVGYRLRASSGALTPGDSTAFNITANRLIFSVSPGNGAVGQVFPIQPVVRAEDTFGTLDTTYTGTVTLAIANGTGTAGATLGGAKALAAVGGVASFSGLKIDRMGTGYRLSASANGLAGATSTAFDIGKAMIYLPNLVVPRYPDLVGSFKLSKTTFDPFDPVLIMVTITNNGDAPASNFWVDFYINPLVPPTTTNQPWDKSCGTVRCRYGIAWYVADTIAPGQSLTLYSLPNSYYAKNTDWPGRFETKKLDLYLYVDSWNPGIPTGAVIEKNEGNNRAEMHIGSVQPGIQSFASAAPQPALPPRPAVP